eukprot:2044481-Ditylum_brightwellii.AAC.1
MQGGEDGKGLGWWSFVQLSERDQRKGNSKIKSRKAFNQDLLAERKGWRQEGNIVYLGIDANSNINNRELSKFVVEATLYDLVGAKHSKGVSNTHINRSRAVDSLFGSEDAVDPVEKVGMLAFNAGIDLGHHAFVLDINQHHLLRGDIHQIAQCLSRKLHTKYKKKIRSIGRMCPIISNNKTY